MEAKERPLTGFRREAYHGEIDRVKGVCLLKLGGEASGGPAESEQDKTSTFRPDTQRPGEKCELALLERGRHAAAAYASRRVELPSSCARGWKSGDRDTIESPDVRAVQLSFQQVRLGLPDQFGEVQTIGSPRSNGDFRQRIGSPSLPVQK